MSTASENNSAFRPRVLEHLMLKVSQRLSVSLHILLILSLPILERPGLLEHRDHVYPDQQQSDDQHDPIIHRENTKGQRKRMGILQRPSAHSKRSG